MQLQIFLSNNELHIRNEKLEFRINDEEELFILTEVFWRVLII